MLDFTDKAKIRTAITKLENHAHPMKIEGAQALQKLAARSATNQTTIAEKGGLSGLMGLLTETSAPLRQAVLEALLSLVMSHDANQATLRSNSAFTLMTQMSNTESNEALKKVVQDVITACPATLSGHTHCVNALTVLPNGHLVSGSSDNTIKMWDVTRGACLSTLSGHTNSVVALTVLPNGHLASGSWDKTIKVWDVTRGVCVSTLSEHRGRVNALTVLPNGHLASGSAAYTIDDYTIKVWDDVTRAYPHASTLSAHHSVNALTALPNGHLASGSTDYTIKVWEVTRGTCVSTLSGHTNNIDVLTVLPNGHLASGSWDMTIKVWDVTQGVCVSTLSWRHTYYWVTALTVLPNGHLASGSSHHNNTIKVWDVTRGVCVSTLLGHTTGVYALTVLPNGHLASGSGDNTIKVWDLGFRPIPGLNNEAASKKNTDEESAQKQKEAEDRLKAEQVRQAGDAARASVEKTRQDQEAKKASERLQEKQLQDERDAASRLKDEQLRKEREIAVQKDAQLAALERQLKKERDAREQLEKANIVAPLLLPPTPPISSKSSSHSTVLPPPVIAADVIPFDELTLGQELGRGGFGVVCEAWWQRATQVAVKQLLGKLTSDLLEEFQRETAVHAGLRHPNIILLYGICVEASKVAMVMEFMANGSLYDVLKHPAELPWSLRLKISLDIASGLLYLHGKHIIHRDLKSLNILMDGQMHAKVSDFGLSKIKLTTASITKGGGGTPHWLAPELFDENPHNQATDVYATGMVFWEIAARKLPYEGKTPAQIMRYVDSGKRETIPSEALAPFATLITRCWAQRSEDRPVMSDVVKAMLEMSSGNEAAGSSGHQVTPPPSVVTSGYMAFSRR